MNELIEFAGKNIEEVEGDLLNLPQVDCPVIHRFSNGLYIRELFMPAGTIAIGHVQNFPQYNVMLKGKVIMLNDDGTTTELIAPQTFTGKAGRKIGYIVEDVVWQNIYPTNETNIGRLEETYLTKSDTFKYNKALKFKIDELEREADRADFESMVKEFGISKDLIRAQSENELDYIEVNIDSMKIKLGKSPIEGTGLFATSYIQDGEIICIARVDGYRTQAGRYTNHSHKPNAKMIIEDGNIYLVAIKNINGCMGGDLGDEITVDYRQVVQDTAKEAVCLE